MHRFAIAGLACILSVIATTSRAEEGEEQLTHRARREVSPGVWEEKLVTEREWKRLQRPVDEGLESEATKTPQPIGPYARGEAVYPQPAPYPSTAAAPVPARLHPAPWQPGTFSVVSDGKRSILLNTATGVAWLLVIDEQGSHWEAIKFPAPAAPIQEMPATYLPGPSTPQAPTRAPVPVRTIPPQSVVPQPVLDATSNIDPLGAHTSASSQTTIAPLAPTPIEPQAAAPPLSASDVQRLEQAYTSQLQTINQLQTQLQTMRDRSRDVAMMLETQKESLINKVNRQGNQIAELNATIEQLKSELKGNAASEPTAVDQVDATERQAE